MAIDDFRGRYFFLSNFSPSPIRHGGILYPTVEHAYQAGKILDMEIRRALAIYPTPGDAKKMGRKLKMRDDWDEVKVPRMRTCLKKKFQDPSLRRKLLETGDQELIEGNTWGDTFWGVYRGKGKNMLGILLMEVRRDCQDS